MTLDRLKEKWNQKENCKSCCTRLSLYRVHFEQDFWGGYMSKSGMSVGRNAEENCLSTSASNR